MGVVLIAKSLAPPFFPVEQWGRETSAFRGIRSPWKWFERKREREGEAFQKNLFFIFIDDDVSCFPLQFLFILYDGSLSHVPLRTSFPFVVD